jgi:hypothetical protein
MENLAIVSVIYEEQEWEQTKRSIDKIDCLKVFVSRGGDGSLAKAVNDGIKRLPKNIRYVWIITNILFEPEIAERLVSEMERTEYAAITPAFHSDHLFCRPAKDRHGVAEVPFVEFTCPIVRVDVMRRILLDEEMPYVGHDIDFGYRARKAGYKLGVDYDTTIGHVYIRNNKQPEPITLSRAKKREDAVPKTTNRLIKKYGPRWQKILMYGGAV